MLPDKEIREVTQASDKEAFWMLEAESQPQHYTEVMKTRPCDSNLSTSEPGAGGRPQIQG